MLLADAADGTRAVPQTGAGILDQNTLTQLQRAVQTCRGVVVVSLSATLLRCSPSQSSARSCQHLANEL